MIDQIIDKSFSLFCKYGIKSVTMDDIATQLGVSKKTLYLHVSDKKELVRQTVDWHIGSVTQNCEIVFDKNVNPIDQLLGIIEVNRKWSSNMNTALIFDLQKYHPDAWVKVEKHKREFIYRHVYDNLVSGQEKGYYRKEIKPDIISKYYIGMIGVMMNAEIFTAEEFDMTKLQTELVIYHIHGISTQKGIEYLEQKLKTPTDV